MRIGVLVVVLLLAGCASGIRAVTPYTSDEIEAARAKCLEVGVWVESQGQARCVLPPPGEKI